MNQLAFTSTELDVLDHVLNHYRDTTRRTDPHRIMVQHLLSRVAEVLLMASEYDALEDFSG